MSVKVHVKVINVSNLQRTDPDTYDSYVAISLNGKDPKAETQRVSGTGDPSFDQEFDFISKRPERDIICFETFDERRNNTCTNFDTIKIKVKSLPIDGNSMTKSVKLKKKDENINQAGFLNIDLSAVPLNEDESINEPLEKALMKKPELNHSMKKRKKTKDSKKNTLNDDDLAHFETDLQSSDSSRSNIQSSVSLGEFNTTFIQKSISIDENMEDGSFPPTKYLIHIKCLNAEALPKSDFIAKSDPYVVFNVSGFNIKMQTTIMENTQDPYYYEEFTLNGYYLSTDELVVSVWDRDPFKDDRVCGVIIPLRYFVPGMLETMNLQLYRFDKSGSLDKKVLAGKLNIVVQIGQIGEIPFLEKRWLYPIYTVNVQIVQCFDIPPVEDNSANPYITCSFNDRKRGKFRTKVQSDTLKPIFDEKFRWHIEDLTDKNIIHLGLWNKNSTKDELISRIHIDITQCEINAIYEYIQSMRPIRKYKTGGDVFYRIHITNLGEKAFLGEECQKSLSEVKLEDLKVLHLQICQAQNFMSSKVEKCDSFVKLCVDDNSLFESTKVRKNTLNPVWNEKIDWSPCNQDSKVKLQLWSSVDKENEELIDEVVFDMKKFKLGKVYKRWFRFKKNGKIEVWIHFDKSNVAPFAAEEKDEETIEDDQEEEYAFSWGSMGSSYSTDFSSYTDVEPLSSLSSDEMEAPLIHDSIKPIKEHRKDRKKCIIKVISADNLNIPKICKGVLNPCVTVNALSHDFFDKTSVQSNTTSPEWDEELTLKRVEKSDVIELIVYHEKAPRVIFPVGFLKIPLDEIFDSEEDFESTYELTKPAKMVPTNIEYYGSINLCIKFRE